MLSTTEPSVMSFKKKLLPAQQSVRCLGCGALVFFMLISAVYLFELDGFKHALPLITIVMSVLSVALLVLDLYGAMTQPRIYLARKAASSIAVNRWVNVSLTLNHSFSRDYSVEIFEHLPDYVDSTDMPLLASLCVANKTHLEYKIKSYERGPLNFWGTFVRVPSPLGFWVTQYRVTTTQHGEIFEQNIEKSPTNKSSLQKQHSETIRVYPDFKAITTYTLLATDNHTSQLGIKRKQRRGEGLDFLQLREYRKGDSLRRIDWKATSRRNELISREYQDERDQQVVILLDCGRRMRAQDDDLVHFDHALNASLLLSYIALRQGDSVGFLTFGGEARWIAPQKGLGKMKTILSQLYDVKTSKMSPDYIEAAEKLIALNHKRSLIVLVTNSRDEDTSEILMAADLLKRRHLVLVANIREAVIDSMDQREVDDLNDALNYAGAFGYLSARDASQSKMKNKGIFLVDCLASELSVKVCNSYLEIKSCNFL